MLALLATLAPSIAQQGAGQVPPAAPATATSAEDASDGARWNDDPIPPTPYDRVIELEITAADPVLVDGRGPTVVVEYEVEFEGTLHVWALSDMDLPGPPPGVFHPRSRLLAVEAQ